MITLTWYGHATWAINADGTEILIDPFISKNPTATVSPDEM
ncbi:MAG: MBL fold metallo-hydrolase, partial [Anaerolineae bacterium]